MSINEIYNLVGFISNKQQTGNLTPARFNLAISAANLSLYKRYCAIPEEWAPGQPLSKIAFSLTNDIEAAMKKFKGNSTLNISATTGRATTPSDIVKESTLTFITQKNGATKYYPVTVCNDEEWQEHMASFIVQPNLENPICNFQNGYVQFAPINLIAVNMIYLRVPITPVWAYTLSSNRPVYDSANSVQVEFPDHMHLDFVMRTCSFLGINMEKGALLQYSEQYKQAGQ